MIRYFIFTFFSIICIFIISFAAVRMLFETCPGYNSRKFFELGIRGDASLCEALKENTPELFTTEASQKMKLELLTLEEMQKGVSVNQMRQLVLWPMATNFAKEEENFYVGSLVALATFGWTLVCSAVKIIFIVFDKIAFAIDRYKRRKQNKALDKIIFKD